MINKCIFNIEWKECKWTSTRKQNEEISQRSILSECSGGELLADDCEQRVQLSRSRLNGRRIDDRVQRVARWSHEAESERVACVLGLRERVWALDVRLESQSKIPKEDLRREVRVLSTHSHFLEYMYVWCMKKSGRKVEMQVAGRLG